MKPVERFFRKYFISMAGIIALFLLLNVVLLSFVLLWAWQDWGTPELSMKEVQDSIVLDEAGNLTAAEGMAELLEKHGAWVMLLDDRGRILFQECLPKELHRQYTLTDVAKFSRWYLEGYPVYVREHPEGLLVIGYEKGSRVRYSFFVNEAYVRRMLTGAAAIFLANIAVVILLIWKNSRHIEKAVAPILQGIETISSGQPVNLPEKGELGEINQKLNRAGDFIVKKDHARAQWISGVSHDIRTPLSVILGFAGQLEEDPDLPEAAQKQAGCIRSQGERLRDLILDLNLASRLEYSMQPLRTDKVYLVELARQAVCEFLDGGLEERYEIGFYSNQNSEKAWIMGDEALLKRGLRNLIQNSIIHNPQGCRILVSVLWEETGIVITVADDGVGVSEEKLKELNGRTAPPDSTDERLNLRHGLGLLIVRQIVEAHEGTMKIESGPQGGCQTTLGFP